MADRILDIGQGNAVSVAELTFRKGSSADGGGAIKMKGGKLRLADCNFIGNSAATSGGAVYAGNCEWLKVENCRFEENTAGSTTQGGGAIYGGVRISVVNTSFWKNEASYGGAVYCAATNTFVNCSVFKNSAWQTGGGIYSGGSNDMVAVINCTLQANSANCQENSAANYDGGGGFFAECTGADASVTLVNSFFIGNRLDTLKRPDVDFGNTNSIPGLKVYASMFGKAASQIKQRIATYVWTGKEARDFFENGVRDFNYQKLTKHGVEHDYLRTTDPCGDIGYSIFHDANWDNVALAAGATGEKTAVIGSKEKATMLLMEDISSRDLGRYARNSQCGSYWYIHDHPEYGTVVTKIEDESDYYDGALTLREIIDGIAEEEDLWRTNLIDGVYRVTFTNALAGQTIRLQGAQFDVFGLTNDVNVVIDGEDLGITIDGSSGLFSGGRPLDFRGFRVQRNATLTLKNLRFVNCVGCTLGKAPVPGFDGGAVLNHGKTVIENCTFESCSSGPSAENTAGFGGAICNGAVGTNGCELVVRDSTFRSCLAAEGGAIYNYGGNSVTLSGCTFTDNRAHPGNASVYLALGGAICMVASGELAYSGCAFTNNTVLLDGKELPSDVQAKNAPYYTVRYTGGVWSISLNALALPDAAGMTLDMTSGATMPDGVTPAVTMWPTGLRPGLSYALGYTYDLGVSFKADEGTWVKADAGGNLSEPLRAPAAKDHGFYKVFVRE